MTQPRRKHRNALKTSPNIKLECSVVVTWCNPMGELKYHKGWWMRNVTMVTCLTGGSYHFKHLLQFVMCHLFSIMLLLICTTADLPHQRENICDNICSWFDFQHFTVSQLLLHLCCYPANPHWAGEEILSCWLSDMSSAVLPSFPQLLFLCAHQGLSRISPPMSQFHCVFPLNVSRKSYIWTTEFANMSYNVLIYICCNQFLQLARTKTCNMWQKCVTDYRIKSPICQ